MERFLFNDKLREIYASFGRRYPDDAIVEQIYSRVDKMPDEFIVYAAEKLRDRADLPKNMGLALKDLSLEYYADHPEFKPAPQRGCPECEGERPGWFRVYDNMGYEYWLKCACNRDAPGRLAEQRAWTRREAREHGFLFDNPVHPGASTEGVNQWEKFKENSRISSQKEVESCRSANKRATPGFGQEREEEFASINTLAVVPAPPMQEKNLDYPNFEETNYYWEEVNEWDLQNSCLSDSVEPPDDPGPEGAIWETDEPECPLPISLNEIIFKNLLPTFAE